MQISNNSDHIRLVFESDLSVGGVRKLFESLNRVLDTPPQLIILDAGKVQKIDVAVFQAFVLVIRELREKAVKMQWEGCAESIIDSAKLLGLAEALELNQ